MRGWSDGIIPLAAAGLALLGEERAHGQTLATHRIPAALALEAVDTAVASCTAQGYGVTTVIDADAQRIAVLRCDGAGVHTFEASWGRAYGGQLRPHGEASQQRRGSDPACSVHGEAAARDAPLPASRGHDPSRGRADYQAG
jgi:Haem-degrading